MAEETDRDSCLQSLAKLPPSLRRNLAVVVLAIASAALLVANQIAAQPAAPATRTAWYTRFIRSPWSVSPSPVQQATERVVQTTDKFVDAGQDLADRVLTRIEQRAKRMSPTDTSSNPPSANQK